MSLAEKLQEIKNGAKERIPEETRKLMQRGTAELRESGIMAEALAAGESLPPFELPNIAGDIVSSAELLKQGNLVLTFYRGNW